MEQNYSKVFETLNKIDCSAHTETKKQGTTNLTYLSWAWAWAEVKKAFPNATFTIYENAQGWNYHTDGRTAWVKTGVTIEGVEMVEYLPVMDFRNQSIPLDKITSFDVNKAIQRSLTKAAARHGLGLYIYAGEDLPEEPDDKPASKGTTKKETKTVAATSTIPSATTDVPQAVAENEIPAPKNEDEKLITACKTKAELNALFVKKNWLANQELLNYAKPIADKLPKE